MNTLVYRDVEMFVVYTGLPLLDASGVQAKDKNGALQWKADKVVGLIRAPRGPGLELARKEMVARYMGEGPGKHDMVVYKTIQQASMDEIEEAYRQGVVEIFQQ